MKSIISLSAGLILVALAGAKVCDQVYHMQTATQFMLEGDSPTTLAPKGAAVPLDLTMNGATLLHDSTEYKMITDFDATNTCDAYVKKSVSFALRPKAAKSFSPSVEDFSVKFNDSAFTYKTPGWDDYWFGFASDVSGGTATLYEEIGKKKGETPLHIWYGNAILKRTLKSIHGETKSSSVAYYYGQTSFPDSAALAQVLLNTWKQYVKDDTTDILFTVQLIKITYDSMATPISTGIRAAKTRNAAVSAFHSSQFGQMVLIQPGSKQSDLAEPLSLYGMMGNKVASLYPTGYAYQWNGKTSFGTDAPTGVYFVQAGNRVLGKFFYTR